MRSEKLFKQPNNLFEAVDFSDLDLDEVSEKQVPRFIEGENYALKGVACDGFEMKTKTYKLIKIVDDFYGTNINSLIVKQIDGEQGVIFTLSKNDCVWHNIEYENGLQLFPQSLNWVRVKEKIPFDKNNLATTPRSDFDNTIRFILLKLNGFKDYVDGLVLTPSGCLIPESQFFNSLRVTTREPIIYNNNLVILDKTNLNIKLVYPKNVLFNHGNFISSEDTIFILIDLKKHGRLNDGHFGVDPKYLDGFNPNDIFEISWNEDGALTTEEYKKLKLNQPQKNNELLRGWDIALGNSLSNDETELSQTTINPVDFYYNWFVQINNRLDELLMEETLKRGESFYHKD